MSRLERVRASFRADWRSFLRRRTAVFFTFFFPVIIVVVFGVLVGTQPASGGLFGEPAGYYLPGYLAVVVLFTPLSRVGSEVARHRNGNRFEKLATTPLTRGEWLLAGTLVNVVVIGLAAALLFVLVVGLTAATPTITVPGVALLACYVAAAVALFCGVGALLGSFADSQDGVVAASNAIALPLLFLSETFVPPSILPGWLPLWLSPLTYFSRGIRAVTSGAATGGAAVDPRVWNLLVVVAVAGLALAAGAAALPRTD